MYHAVMEEVVRFLERCHQSFNVMQATAQQQQISRSKSVSHVYGGGDSVGGQETSLLDSTLLSNHQQQQQSKGGRLRTSTTILEKPQSLMTMMSLDETVDHAGSDSFAQFKDFTW